MDTVEKILKELLTASGVPFSGISKSEIAGQEIYSIQTEGDARSLIGPHGDTIHAIDLLVKKIYENRQPAQAAVPAAPEGADASERVRGPMFLVDINDYRAKQIKDLQAKALVMAERARSFQYDVELSPMSSYERLIIHTTLQGAANVKTESQGEGRNRRVVIKYAA